MKIIGLDIGTVRVGIAVADTATRVATPRETVPRKKLLERLTEMTQAEGFARIVAGLPLRTGGEEGPEAEAVRRLAGEIAASLGVEVDLQDERFTTWEVERAIAETGGMKKKKRKSKIIDALAAQRILQAWLDRRG